jgi:hypothetical protein
MKEKELRLALVCYGGVSLVLYMHGVIKEMLKLSRASKAYHSVPQSEQREHQGYEAANGDDGRPHDTEDVYFTLLQSIGRTLSLRVIVDSIAGASAGARIKRVGRLHHRSSSARSRQQRTSSAEPAMSEKCQRTKPLAR